MKNFGVYEAKNRLTELLQQVADGDSFIITKHGKPIASVQPYRPEQCKVSEGLAVLRALGDVNLKGVNLNALLKDGTEG